MGTILPDRSAPEPRTPGMAESPYLRRLWLGRYRFEREYYFDARLGTPVNSIGVLLRGNAEFVTPTRRFELKSGQAVFVPRGEKYQSFWRGLPVVEWCALHFLFSVEPDAAAAGSTRRYQLQPIAGWNPGDAAQFREIAACGVDSSPTHAALGHFYLFFSGIVSRLAFDEVSQNVQPLQPALHFLEAHPCEDFVVGQLAALCGLSESRFYAAFAAHTGCSPIEYKNRIRIQRAMAMLSESGRTVEGISRELNFCTPAYFRRVFKKVAGKTPREYRLSI